jgi:hypothetical protein
MFFKERKWYLSHISLLCIVERALRSTADARRGRRDRFVALGIKIDGEIIVQTTTEAENREVQLFEIAEPGALTKFRFG